MKTLFRSLDILTVSAALKGFDEKSTVRLQIFSGKVGRQTRPDAGCALNRRLQSPIDWAPYPTTQGRLGSPASTVDQLAFDRFIVKVALDELDIGQRIHR